MYVRSEQGNKQAYFSSIASLRTDDGTYCTTTTEDENFIEDLIDEQDDGAFTEDIENIVYGLADEDDYLSREEEEQEELYATPQLGLEDYSSRLFQEDEEVMYSPLPLIYRSSIINNEEPDYFANLFSSTNEEVAEEFEELPEPKETLEDLVSQ